MPRAFLAASFVAMLAASVASVFGASVPAISAATGVRPATVGQLTTVLGVGGFLPLLVWRRRQQRDPTRLLVAGALALLSVGTALVALNPAASRTPTTALALWLLAATVLLVGVAFGWAQVAISSVVANRGASPRTLNALHGTYGAGAVAMPLVAALTDLRTVAVLASALAAAAVPGLLRAPDLRVPDGPGAEAGTDERRDDAAVGHVQVADPTVVRPQPSPGATVRTALVRLLRRCWFGDGVRPWVWMFSVAIGAEIGTLAWATTHLVSRGESDEVAAAAVSGYFAVYATTRFVLAAVVDRLDLRRVVVTANALAAVAAASAAASPLPVLSWVLVGVGVGPVFPTTLAWVARVTDDPDAARKLLLGGALGAVVLPGVIGLLTRSIGPSAIPWATATAGAAAAMLAATLPRTDGRRPTATGAATSTTP